MPMTATLPAAACDKKSHLYKSNSFCIFWVGLQGESSTDLTSEKPQNIKRKLQLKLEGSNSCQPRQPAEDVAVDPEEGPRLCKGEPHFSKEACVGQAEDGQWGDQEGHQEEAAGVS